MHVHTVLLTFADPIVVDALVRRMETMAGRIPGLIDVTVTRNEVEGPWSADLALTTRFVDLDAYLAYRTDPVHQAVAAEVRALMVDARTLDWTADP